MTTNQFKRFLKITGACSSGCDWVQRQIKKGKSPKEIWESCKNNNYKYWMALKLSAIDASDFYNYRLENNLQYYSMSDKERNQMLGEFMKRVEYKDINRAVIGYLKGWG